MRWLALGAVWVWLFGSGVAAAQPTPPGEPPGQPALPSGADVAQQDGRPDLQRLSEAVDEREAIAALLARVAQLESDAEVGSAEARLVRLERVAQLATRIESLEQPGDGHGVPKWVAVVAGLLGGAVGSGITYWLEWRKVRQGDTKIKHDLWMKLVEVVLVPGVRFEQRMSYLRFLAQVSAKGGKVDVWAKASSEAHEKVAPRRPERWLLQGEISDRRTIEENRRRPASERERARNEREALEQELRRLEDGIRADMPDFPFGEDSPPAR